MGIKMGGMEFLAILRDCIASIPERVLHYYLNSYIDDSILSKVDIRYIFDANYKSFSKSKDFQIDQDSLNDYIVDRINDTDQGKNLLSTLVYSLRKRRKLDIDTVEAMNLIQGGGVNFAERKYLAGVLVNSLKTLFFYYSNNFREQNDKRIRDTREYVRYTEMVNDGDDEDWMDSFIRGLDSRLRVLSKDEEDYRRYRVIVEGLRSGRTLEAIRKELGLASATFSMLVHNLFSFLQSYSGIRGIGRRNVGGLPLAEEFLRDKEESEDFLSYSGGMSLEPRKREVLELFGSGRTIREVSEKLNISFRRAGELHYKVFMPLYRKWYRVRHGGVGV